MKRLMIVFYMVCMVFFANAQNKHFTILPLDAENKINYTQVVQLDSVKASELYTRAKLWLANTYKSSKDVIQVDDKENTLIVGKGIIVVSWQITFYSFANTNLYHTVSIQCKDGRYKYEINQFKVNYYVKEYGEVNVSLEEFNTNRPDNLKKYLVSVDKQVLDLIKSLEIAMQKPSKSSDW